MTAAPFEPPVVDPPPSRPDTAGASSAAPAVELQCGSRVVEQCDISDRLELLVIEDVIYGTPTTVFEIHCWDCQGTDEFDSRDDAITYGHERHRCRHAGD